MSDIFNPRPLTEQVIVRPYRHEQTEQDEAQEQLALLNSRYRHDPFWRTRFWSVQHVRDVIDGKANHWFWSPLKGLAEGAAVAFAIMPMLTILSTQGYRFSLLDLTAVYLSATLLIAAFGQVLHWLYWWRFERIRRRITRPLFALSGHQHGL